MSYDQKPQIQPGPTAPMTTSIQNALNKPVDANGNREWSNGLCSCFDDCGTCVLAWCCPCIVHAQVKQRYEHLANQGTPDPDHGGSGCDGECLLFSCLQCAAGLGFILTMFNRSSIRARYRISGNGCTDCLASYFCTPCALTQQSRELQLEENGGAKV